MNLGINDFHQLIAPLFSGLVRPNARQTFLKQLAQSIQAEHCGLRLQGPGGASMYRWSQATKREGIARWARARLRSNPAPSGVTPLQVYSYSELLDLSSPEYRNAESLFASAKIADGIWMLIPNARRWFASIMLEHSERAFTQQHRKLLADLGPYLSIAIDILCELEHRLRRAEMAEHTLGALGISQALIGRDCRIVATDPGHLGNLEARTGSKLHLAKSQAADLARKVDQLAIGQVTEAIVRDGGPLHRDLLLRPVPPSAGMISIPEATVVTTREVPPTSAEALANALRSLYDLSPREAQIAAALARGEQLVPAGEKLGLRPETARAYSKQVYAKTGTRNQADLVRVILSGLAYLFA